MLFTDPPIWSRPARMTHLSSSTKGDFGYFFADGETDERLDLMPWLQLLANSLLDPALENGGDDPAHDGTIAAIYTYLGYMIEHDIAAPFQKAPLADEEEGRALLSLAGYGLLPLERDVVRRDLGNRHSGGLRLESLYGDALPHDKQMRLRRAEDSALMRTEPEFSTLAESRNQAHAVLARVHLAMLRLHNIFARQLKNEVPNPLKRFSAARKQTTWLWQWLVINDYLAHLCEPNVLDHAFQNPGRFFEHFQARQGATPGKLSVPLEYSFAVAGFSHAMIRAAYDLNDKQGRPAKASARVGVPLRTLLSDPAVLPAMERLVQMPPAFADRAARRIDTGLAHPLGSLSTKAGDWPDSLPLRCLKLGYRLALPTAQAALTAYNQFARQQDKPRLVPLSAADLATGPTGPAMAQGGFLQRTPLWVYILKEAELRADGLHLGPLGSSLLAETLIGLVVADPDSYWHARGNRPGHWRPNCLRVGTGTVNSFQDLFEATGMMPTLGSKGHLSANGTARSITGA